MAYCRKCGAYIDEDTVVCPKCGVQVRELAVERPQSYDSGSFGWAVLGFFIPIVGLILWLVWKDEKPRSAARAGKGALWSVIIEVVLWLLLVCAGALS